MTMVRISAQVEDAILLARLHRATALDLIHDAEDVEHQAAITSASNALTYADEALVLFRRVNKLLPDLKAARQAKLTGDLVLLESGAALLKARQMLGKEVS